MGPTKAPSTTDPFRSRLQWVAVLGFPVLLIASDLAVAGVSGDDSGSYLASVADHRSGVRLGALLGMAAVLLFAAFAQIASERLAPAAPRWAWHAKIVAWVGLFAGYAINAAGLFDWAMTDPSLSRPEMTKLADVVADGPTFLAIYNPGLLTPLGFLALGIGLWRTRSVPRWAGAALVAAAVSFPAGQIGGILPVQVVCAALFLAAGVGLLSTRPSPAGSGSHRPERNGHDARSEPGRRGPRRAARRGALTMLALLAAACSDGADTRTVTAVDYGFENLPTSVKAGTTLAFENGSTKEVHEMVVIKLPDSEQRSAEELVKLPEGQLDALAGGPPAAVLIAPPGGAPQINAVGDGKLTEKGRYLVICAIPVGADPTAYLQAAQSSGDGPPPQVAGGPPHLAQGMYGEITVK